MRFCCPAALLLLIGNFLVASLPAAELDADKALPEWIWAPSRAGSAARHVRLQGHIEVDSLITHARLRCATEYCDVQVIINGATALAIEDYAPWSDDDVTARVRRGDNTVAIHCQPTLGPAAVALTLELTDSNGRVHTLATSSAWQARWPGSRDENAQAIALDRVPAHLWGRSVQPAIVTPFDDYEQWRRALETQADPDPASFWLPDGFTIERLRLARPDEGSWVAIEFDPQGRLIVAREDKGLLRMTIPAGTDSIVQVETVNDELQECRGLLFSGDDLYVNANNSKGFYRLQPSENGRRFSQQLLRTFSGSVGHGRNDLTLGRDGSIFAIFGDAVDVPNQDLVDRTSPLREARRGLETKEGFLMKFDPNGSQWELICAGLRNPFGIAVDPQHGELFTYDADAEHDMGSPWYRPTRIVHLVSGADYGWRGVTGRWPPYFPDHADNALPVGDIGKGSPTAVQFGDRSHFPGRFRSALYVLDWAYGRVLAVHLVPRGASYTGQSEVFLRGQPLNVTDLDFGPDGAMYLVTGGRKTQSALYRVRFEGAYGADDSPSTQQQRARQEFSEQMRSLRKELEQFHRPAGPDALDTIWPHLEHPDHAIRHAARIALEHQPLGRWQERALNGNGGGQLQARLALARVGDPRLAAEILERLTAAAWEELPATERIVMLQTITLCLDSREKHAEPLGSSLRGEICDTLRLWLEEDRARVVLPLGLGGPLEREAILLLVRLGDAAAVPLGMELLAAETSPEGRLHYLFALRAVREGWTTEMRRAYFEALREAAMAQGGQGLPGFIQNIRGQAVATLTAEERAALGDLLEPQNRQVSTGSPVVQRPFFRQWQMADFADVDLERGPKGYQPDDRRGERLFDEVLCRRCHRLGSIGGVLGPDLTSVSSRFGRRDLLQSILLPSLVIAEPYRNVELLTKDGRLIVGQVVPGPDYRSSLLHVAPDPLDRSKTVQVEKSAIEEYDDSATSPMPAGLLDTLTREEILDLLAYLEAGGNSQE